MPAVPSLLVGDGPGEVTLEILPSGVAGQPVGFDAKSVVLGRGEPFTGSGTIVLDDALATLRASELLVVGETTLGVLDVSDGAVVETEGASMLGAEALAMGRFELRLGGTWRATNQDALVVGGDGFGEVLVTNGGIVETTMNAPVGEVGEVIVGAGPDSDGRISILGAGSSWIESGADTRLVVPGEGLAEVIVGEGAVLAFPTIVNTDPTRGFLNFADGAIIGQPGGETEIRNRGRVRIGGATAGLDGAPAPATVTLFGEFNQFAVENSDDGGRLEVRVFDQGGALVSDLLDVTGTVDIRGGLFVEPMSPTLPDGDATLAIVRSTTSLSLNARAIIQTPVVSPSRYLKVVPPGANPAGIQELQLQIASIEEILGLAGGAAADGVTGNPNAITVGDFDADGQDDLAVVLPDTEQVAVIISNEDVGGGWTGTATFKNTGPSPVSIAAGDLDGDGAIDLAVGLAGNTDRVDVYFNPGDGAFPVGASDQIVPGDPGVPVFDDPISLAIDRFGDADPTTQIDDLAILATDVDAAGARVVVLDVVASIGEAIVIEETAQLDAPPDPVIIDPLKGTGNKDGLSAIAVVGRDGPSVIQLMVFGQDAGGGYTSGVGGVVPADAMVSFPGDPAGLSGAEIVRERGEDEREDLVVVTDASGDRVYVSVLGNIVAPGTLSLDPPQALEGASEPTSVTAVDIDDDGDDDIVVVTRPNGATDRDVRVFRNNYVVEDENGMPVVTGLIQFETPVLADVGTDPVQVVRGDFDGNAVEDVAVIDAATGGTGPGSPTGGVVVGLNLESGIVPPPPCPADLDANGAVDFSDLLTLLSGYGACPDPPQTCAADIDGSGAVDFSDLLALLAAYGPCPTG